MQAIFPLAAGLEIFLQDPRTAPVLIASGMKFFLLLAQGPTSALPGGRWSFVALVLVIVIVTLIVADGSKNKDK
jgi:hypothetical protein